MKNLEFDLSILDVIPDSVKELEYYNEEDVKLVNLKKAIKKAMKDMQ